MNQISNLSLESRLCWEISFGYWLVNIYSIFIIFYKWLRSEVRSIWTNSSLLISANKKFWFLFQNNPKAALTSNKITKK